MKFFLESAGLKLATFTDMATVEAAPKAQVLVVEKKPFISPLGFEVDQTFASQPPPVIEELDPKSDKLRALVLNAFARVAIFAEDTKQFSSARLHVNTNDFLIVILPTINHMCSKMHIEDISPVEVAVCNHDTIKCTEAHPSDDTLLLEDTDFVPTTKADACFKADHSQLYFYRGKKWIKIQEHCRLKNGFYTINDQNFL